MGLCQFMNAPYLKIKNLIFSVKKNYPISRRCNEWHGQTTIKVMGSSLVDLQNSI